jgi:hypothetical protein
MIEGEKAEKRARERNREGEREREIEQKNVVEQLHFHIFKNAAIQGGPAGGNT